jgi:hypothetical protein
MWEEQPVKPSVPAEQPAGECLNSRCTSKEHWHLWDSSLPNGLPKGLRTFTVDPSLDELRSHVRREVADTTWRWDNHQSTEVIDVQTDKLMQLFTNYLERTQK